MKNRAYTISKMIHLLLICIALPSTLVWAGEILTLNISNGTGSTSFIFAPDGFADYVNVAPSDRLKITSCSPSSPSPIGKITKESNTCAKIEGRGGTGGTFTISGVYIGNGPGTATWSGMALDVTWEGDLLVSDKNTDNNSIIDDSKDEDPIPVLLAGIDSDQLGDIEFSITTFPTPIVASLAILEYKHTTPDSSYTTSSLSMFGGFSSKETLNNLAVGEHLLEVYKLDASEGNSTGKLPCYNRKVQIIVYGVDLDVDSDNDGTIDATVEEEDSIEDKTGDNSKPGKFVIVNNDNDDNDGTIDSSDNSNISEDDFVQMKLFIAPYFTNNAKIKFTPASENKVRIWKKPGNIARSASDIIAWNTEIDKSGVPETLYIEGLTASDSIADQEIKVTATENKQVNGSTKTVTAEDTVRVTVLAADLDIDSDNNNGTSAPARSTDEDLIEDKDNELGKVIIVNNSDIDNDNVPDYADMSTAGKQFTPLVLEISKGIDPTTAKIYIDYSDSAPSDVGASPDYTVPAESGRLRLWKKNGDQTRTYPKNLKSMIMQPKCTIDKKLRK